MVEFCCEELDSDQVLLCGIIVEVAFMVWRHLGLRVRGLGSKGHGTSHSVSGTRDVFRSFQASAGKASENPKCLPRQILTAMLLALSRLNPKPQIPQDPTHPVHPKMRALVDSLTVEKAPVIDRLRKKQTRLMMRAVPAALAVPRL